MWVRKEAEWRVFGAAGEGKGDRDGSAEAGTGAAGSGVAAVLAGDVADQEEAEAVPLIFAMERPGTR